MSIKLEDYLKINDISDDDYVLLPLCHTTSIGSFTSIMSDKALKPTEGNPYKELLLHFFYGKACYFVDKKGLENVCMEKPVAMLYSFNQVKQIGFKRVLPFDSGAFERLEFPKQTTRDLFTIYDVKESRPISRLVNLIYGGNPEYLSDKISSASLEREAKQCLAVNLIAELYNRKIPAKAVEAGSQIFCLEMQVVHEVKEAPLAIFFPYELLTAEPVYWTSERISEAFPGVKLVVYAEPGELSSVYPIGMEIELLLRKAVKSKVIEYAGV